MNGNDYFCRFCTVHALVVLRVLT